MIARKIKLSGLIIAAFIILFTDGLPQQFSEGKSAAGKEVMVATAHPLATRAGLDMLMQGGNAIDAAVSSAFVIGVVEPDGSGLGGGGGMVVYIADDKQSHYYNYYARASANIDDIEYDRDIDRQSAKEVLIPGTVAGLLEVHQKYGKLPLNVVMQPAIEHAENGFPIDATLAGIILDNVVLLQKYKSTADIYMPDGFPLMEGDLLVQKNLAATLRIISEKGKAGFYEGSVADAIVEGVQENGGMITHEDLSNYDVVSGSPLTGTYRGYEVLTANVPQSGVAVIEALNILENENLKSLGHYSVSAATLHFMAETFRRIYADRIRYVEDPKFGDIPVEGLISKEYARERYNDIDMTKPDPPEYRKTEPGNPDKYMETGFIPVNDYEENYASQYEYDGHTTHLSVMDAEGNMVSLTQTLGTFFGSGLTAEGVLLNSALSNYSTTVNTNRVENWKQPRSSISPTILLKDSEPFLIIGSPGALRIIAVIVEVIVNIIDFDMAPHVANDAPRFFTQKYEDYLHIENRIEEAVREKLSEMGHPLQVYGELDLFFGGVQLIHKDPETGMLTGSADPRRGGSAAGY